jgi:hypothetical protein
MTDVRDKIQLKKPDGTIIAELPMYRSLYEVPLNRYIDFIKAEEPLHDKEKLEAGEVNVARVLAKCVGEFFGVPLNSVLDAHYGNTDDVPSGGLQSLYVWIANLVGTFQARIRTPQDCYFDYKGERYTVPIIGVQTLSALPLLPAMDTGQMIEAYEIRRIAKRMVETTQDPDGSGLYTYYLNLLSVLALKDGERLPYGESDVENFINQRTEYFADIHGGNGIDAGTALDIDFFLASLMRPCEVTGAAIGTLTNHALDLVAKDSKARQSEQEAFNAAIAHSEQVFEQIGHRQIYLKLLERGWYVEAGKSAVESMKRSNFVDVVRFISMENANL